MIPDPQLGRVDWFRPYSLADRFGGYSEEYSQAINAILNMKPTSHELANRHTYHAPKEGQPAKYEMIRGFGHDFAKIINDLCPDSRELSIAHTKIEEVVFWANASIARGGAA